MSFKLLRLANVIESTSDSFDWAAVNNDPQLWLQGWSRLVNRQVVVSFQIKSDSETSSACVMYMDLGEGYAEKNAVYFSLDNEGFATKQINFPPTLKRVRFDPIARSGLFSVINLNFEIGEYTDSSCIVDVSNIEEIVPDVQFTVDDTLTYEKWIEANEPPVSRYSELKEIASRWQLKPLISILMPTYNTNKEHLIAAIESVRNQTYDHWELCIADDLSILPHVKSLLIEYAERDPRIKVVFRNQNGHISEATNSALEIASGSYIALLDHDDELHPIALHCVAKTIIDYPNAAIIYSDEDKISEDGIRSDPYFKCDFNYDLLLGHNMISHFGVYNHSVLKALSGIRKGFEGSQDYDLALRVLDHAGPNNIVHVPRVLYHWRIHAQSTSSSHDAKPYAQIAALEAIKDHLSRNNIAATVASDTLVPAYNRVTYHLPVEKKPSVEIIIPTKDGASILEKCINSILTKTDYDNFSITIIDNGSEKQETFELFKRLMENNLIRIVEDYSPFNYSALNNKVALSSQSEIVCLMNNDIEVITSNWLSEMVSISIQPSVGCVGAKLLYPNDTLQHAGVVVGICGVAGHAHKGINRSSTGYFCRAALRSSFSAVTAACLVVKQEIYKEVGGLDENLAVAFNDVDFCLRVKSLGYRNVWTPYAELYHHESLTRGYEDTTEKLIRFNIEIDYMNARWSSIFKADPCYSPNLTESNDNFALAWQSRVGDLFADLQ